MEKYTDWRDSFSGIHPFLPFRASWSARSVALACLRLPFFLLFGSLAAVLSVVSPHLARPLAWAALLVAGSPPSRRDRSPSRPLSGSPLVLFNSQSYVDLLVASALVAPASFVFCFGDSLVVRRSLLSALIFVLRGSLAPPSAASFSFSRLSSLPSPVAFFPEGAPSNHEPCLLALEPAIFAGLDSAGLSHHFVFLSHRSRLAPFPGLDQHVLAHMAAWLGDGFWQPVRATLQAGDPAGSEAGWDKLATALAWRRVRQGWRDREAFRQRWLEEAVKE